jgi:hypothetical protein
MNPVNKNARDRIRFWQTVDKTDTCWLWTKPGEDGYGRFYMQGDFHQAHRVSYGWEYSEVPAHLVVDHKCRVPACVRPSHLEPVTNGENVRRGVRKPRSRVPSVEPMPDKPEHKTGSRPRYCRACLRPATECVDIVNRVCADCRAEHKAKALAAINRLMP